MRPGLPLCFALACALVGCAGAGEVPDLLEVSAVHPSTIELGDRLEILGGGFPEGRRGTVTFAGDLARPGVAPSRVRGVVARVSAASRRRLLVDVDEELVAALCGRGRLARHTTFRGTVVVAFSPAQAGAPPVVGRQGDVRLDCLPPPPSEAVLAERAAQAKAAGDALGLVVEVPEPHRVVVKTLDPDGRAAQAGLLPGDRLIEVDGVRLRDETDLALVPGARRAVFRLQRGRLGDPADRSVDLDGLSPMPPDTLAVAVLLVAVVVVGMLLSAVFPGRALTWAERRVLARLQAMNERGLRLRGIAALAAAPLHGLLRSEVPLLLRLVQYLTLLAVTALFAWLALGGVVVAAEADLPLGLLATTTAVVCLGLVAGGRLRGPHWSFRSGLRTALVLFGFQLPLLAATASAVLEAGSPRVRDLVLGQGAAPWQWLVFTTPAAALGAVLVLGALVPRVTASPVTPAVLGEPAPPASPAARRARALLDVADFGHVLFTCSLVALVLCGGYLVPGVTPLEQRASAPLQILGATLLVAKTWVLVAIVGVLRWVVPDLGHAEVSGLFWRLAGPGAVATVGLALAWRSRWAQPLVGGVASGLGVVLSALAFLTLAVVAVRVLRGLRRPPAHAGVNPWL